MNVLTPIAQVLLGIIAMAALMCGVTSLFKPYPEEIMYITIGTAFLQLIVLVSIDARLAKK